MREAKIFYSNFIFKIFHWNQEKNFFQKSGVFPMISKVELFTHKNEDIKETIFTKYLRALAKN